MKSKRFWILFVELLLVAVLLWQGSKVVRYYWDTSASRGRYAKIEEMVREKQSPVEPSPSPHAGDPKRPDPVQEDALAASILAMLRERNEDTVAWIEIDSLHIHYPVVQGADNEEYLYKSFDGEYSIAGSVFLDARDRADFTDRNIVLYGHHMKDGSMFHNLSRLRRKTDWEKPVEITLYTERGALRWRVYTVYSIDEDVDYRSPEFADDEEFRAFLKTTQHRSEQITGTDPAGAEHVLTLSTCTSNEDGQRIVIQAVPMVE